MERPFKLRMLLEPAAQAGFHLVAGAAQGSRQGEAAWGTDQLRLQLECGVHAWMRVAS